MSDKIYQLITDKILSLLESGTIPWRKPWSGGISSSNFISKKPYRGINSLLTRCAPFESPFWMTFKQAKGKGGSIKKGEKATPIIFWKWIKGKDKKTGKEKLIPLLRYYSVFNVEQTEGIEIPAVDKPAELEFNPIERAEEILTLMPEYPTITSSGARACYSPGDDSINMPRREIFTSEAEYYSTLFHEITHWTGHKSRQDREGITGLNFFGSHEYSKEELVAEMGSCFLSGKAGIDLQVIENSAAYISGWSKKLRSNPKWMITAAGKAERAVRWLTNDEYKEEN